MNYLTNYYKNLCENLAFKCQNILNEIHASNLPPPTELKVEEPNEEGPINFQAPSESWLSFISNKSTFDIFLRIFLRIFSRNYPGNIDDLTEEELLRLREYAFSLFKRNAIVLQYIYNNNLPDTDPNLAQNSVFQEWTLIVQEWYRNTYV